MVAVALLSAKGSPGVTTTALALSDAWPQVHPDRRVLIAECDAAGGDIAAGYLRGSLDGARGVLSLAAQRSRNAVEGVWGQVLALDDDGKRLLLPGLTDPSRAAAAEAAWPTLAAALDGLAGQQPPIDVLIDLGRLRTAHEAVILRRRTDLVLLVTGTSLPAVVAARTAAAQLRTADKDGGAPPAAAVVIGEGRPYPAAEVGDAIGLAVIGTMPYDAAAAAVLSRGEAGSRRHARSAFVRSARSLASALLARSPAASFAGTMPATAEPATAEPAGVGRD